MWKASSLRSCLECNVSLPLSSVLSTQAWYTFILVLMVSMELSHTRFARRAIAVAALSICAFSSTSRERLVEMLKPK